MNITFEKWAETKVNLLVQYIAGEVGIWDVMVIAYDQGVRTSKYPAIQWTLNSINFSETHKEETWFQKANSLLQEGVVLRAAQLYISAGYLHAPCCEGHDPKCRLASAIEHLVKHPVEFE